MWVILIPADFRPMGYKLSCCGSIWSGKNLLFKSILGRCDRNVLEKQYQIIVKKSQVVYDQTMKKEDQERRISR